MSLIAQMNRDLEQSQGLGQHSDLPLFAAAEAIHRRRRRGFSSLLVLTVLAVPVVLLGMVLWIAPQSAGTVQLNDTSIGAANTDAPAQSLQPAPAAEVVATFEQQARATQTQTPAALTQGSAPKASALQASASQTTAEQASAQQANAQQSRAELDSSAVLNRSEAAHAVVQRAPAAIQRAAKPIEAQTDQQPGYSRQISARTDSHQPAPTRAKKIEVSASIATARAYAPQGDFIKATSAQSDSQYDAALVERAQRTLRSSGAAAAREVLQRYVSDTVAVTQNLPDSAALYATLLVEGGALQRAQRILDLQLGLHPAVTSLQVAQLRLLVAQARYADAAQWVASLGSDLQRSTQVMEMHAVALQANGEFEAASYVYQQLLGRDTGNARWWMGLAVAFDSNAQASNAKRAYQRALALQNLNAELGNYAQQRVAVL